MEVFIAGMGAVLVIGSLLVTLYVQHRKLHSLCLYKMRMEEHLRFAMYFFKDEAPLTHSVLEWLETGKAHPSIGPERMQHMYDIRLKLMNARHMESMDEAFEMLGKSALPAIINGKRFTVPVLSEDVDNFDFPKSLSVEQSYYGNVYRATYRIDHTVIASGEQQDDRGI